MSLFPTKQWLDEYEALLNESNALDDVAAGWGVGFNGAILLAITDLPLDDTTVRELPESVLADVPEKICEGLTGLTYEDAPAEIDDSVRAELPPVVQDLLTQLEENVVGGAVYAYVGLEEGTCTEVEILENPNERDVGAVIRGPCSTWQQIIDGRPVTSAVLSGDLEVSGNGLLRPQYTALLQLLGDIAADVETTHLFEEPGTSLQDFVLDEAVRQPIAVQRFAYQQAAWATRMFSLF